MLKSAYSCSQQKKITRSSLQVSGSDENCHKNFGCLNGKSRQQRRRRRSLASFVLLATNFHRRRTDAQRWSGKGGRVRNRAKSVGGSGDL